MADLKVLDTRGLLELIDTERCFTVPEEIIKKLDALGRHVFQAHSMYNMDPSDQTIHARSIFKTYDEVDPDRFPLTLVHIPRPRWDDMPDWYG